MCPGQSERERVGGLSFLAHMMRTQPHSTPTFATPSLHTHTNTKVHTYVHPHLNVHHNGECSCYHELEGLVVQFEPGPRVHVVKEYADQDEEDSNRSQDSLPQCEEE